jgi:hypothetical protein
MDDYPEQSFPMQRHILLPLTFLFLPAALIGGEVIISEIMYNPTGIKAEWIEVTNLTTNRLDAAKWALTGGANLTLPDFNSGAVTAHLLIERERILLSSKSPADTRADYPSIPPATRIYGPWVGSLNNAGETITLRDKNGARLNAVTYGDGGRKWPVAPDGTGHSLVTINENRETDDWHNWQSSPRQSGSPGQASIIPSEEIASDPTVGLPLSYAEAVPMNATWSFYKETTAPPTNWNTLAFTPAAPWGSGPALLGFETAALPSPGLQTAVQTASQLTYYFRTNFNWTGGSGGAQFQMDAILDDGATYYINGVYIGNKDGVAAVAHNSSIATTTITDATLVANAVTGNIPPRVLVDGVNVLAAVGLQVNTTSSDMIFGSNLRLVNSPEAELVVNEVFQAPAGSGYIEFYNPGGTAISLLGYHLSDTSGNWTKFPITQNVSVPAGGLATIGFVEVGFSATAPSTTLYLARPDGTPIYGMTAALPQDGRTLGRKPIGASSWFRFSIPTPGAANSSTAGTGGASSYPAFNEVHYDGAGTMADWVEFTNTAASSVSMAGLFVASTKSFSDKVALSGSIAPGAYVSVNTSFAVSGDKITLYLIDGGNNVLTEAQVPRRTGKTSAQVWPTGSQEWFASTASTRDAVNAPDRTDSIVITEIMYSPPSEHRQGEYIELYNRGATAVSLAGWTFDSGIDYTFPAGASIAPGAYLVVAQNAAHLMASNGISNVVGDYGGTLSNAGELIRLEDAVGNLADEVDYKTGGDWPRAADGMGSSLELIHAGMNNDSGSSWLASNETQKGQWANYTYTGTWLNQGVGPSLDTERREINLKLVADSHLILRNITFGPATGAQAALATNISPTNLGSDGWRVTGTHFATFSNAEGLNIVADGAGDMKGNAIELDVPTMNTGNTAYKITFQARWVSGSARLVMNSWDRSWGRTFGIPIPNNLGTPGTLNSRAAANPAPEIWSAIHSPPVPRVTDDVKITARVSSALPATVSLLHREDILANNNAWTTSPMNDAGTAGDERAGDGIYTATISSHKVDGRIVQFYVQAAATGGGTLTYPPAGATLPCHWIVDSSPVTSDLRTHRYIVAQADHNSMGGAGSSATYNYRHPRMSNHYYNSTLIVNEKEILYNVESRKSGSPWTRDGGNSMDRIRSKFPKDRMFRGREKTGLDNDAADNGARRWNNRMSRYWLYLLGYPAAEAEYVHVQFNNLAISLKDDTEPTDTDMLARTYDDPADTELHEVDDAWYFGDDLAGENRGQVNGDWVVTTANIESAVYWQGSWPIRTQNERYDYSPLLSWIRTVYNNGITPADGSVDDTAYRARVESVFDIDTFGRYAAIKGWAGAWDNFTIDRGKNGYVYRRPTDGRWEFEFWDGDLDFQNTGQSVLGGIPGTGPLFSRPWFRRSMNYYLQEIRDQWSMNSPRVYAWLQAMEDQSPSYTIDQNYFKSWFTNRRPTIDGFIGAGNQNAILSATASVGATTALNFTDLSGNAPTGVLNLTVDGHPEGVLTWLTASTWRMTGLSLRQGSNTLTVRAWDRPGNAIGSVNVLVTKTGDAPPILAIVADPSSMNVAIGESLTVESTGSFDPEGTALALSWTINPTAGVTNTPFGLTGRRLLFSTPGIYTVTLNATDGAGSVATLNRQLSVFATSDFLSFGTGYLLPGGLTAANTELRDNDSPASWYSLEDASGKVLLQIGESAAAPLDSASFPSITRALPSGNWLMQTDANLETRKLGEFFNTGLILDMVENGQAVRYVYGWQTGEQVTVRRADPTNFFYAPATNPDPIRINVGGAQVTETDNRIWIADTGFLATPATTTVTQAFAPTLGGAFQHYGLIGDTRRAGISGGGLTYEIPVPNWPNNYSVTLYSALVVSPSQTLTMSVSVNDGTGASWSAGSSASQMRTLPLTNVVRNANGNIKIAVTRTAGTGEAGLSGIEIIPGTAAPPSGGLPALTPAPMAADGFRIEKLGNSLVFSRKVAGVWITDQTRSIPAGSTSVKGGVFASTETPQYVRASFDYLLIADPAKASPILAALRLTEVMYNPAPGGVEYLEFQNIGPDPINLQGVNFPATAPFAAFTFGSETLAPGEFIVLAADGALFRQKYSVAPRLAAATWASGSLDNGGENVVLNDTIGNFIHDFTYNDNAPWPTSPDGQGPSLEVIDVFGNYNDPLNWRASSSLDGTPGGTIRLTDPDTDGDGVPDWVENAFGLASNSPGKSPNATSGWSGGQLTISWPFVPERSYLVECSTDLETWEEVGTVVGQGALMDPSSQTDVRRYYRVTALPYP